MPRLHKSTPSRSKRTPYVEFSNPTIIHEFGKTYKNMNDFARALKFRQELNKRRDPVSKKLRETMEAKEAVRKGYTDRASHNANVKAKEAETEKK